MQQTVTHAQTRSHADAAIVANSVMEITPRQCHFRSRKIPRAMCAMTRRFACVDRRCTRDIVAVFAAAQPLSRSDYRLIVFSYGTR
jgi:hypothetical protein